MSARVALATLAGLAFGVALALSSDAPALACSCAGPAKLAVEFRGEALESPDGRATFGELWRFRSSEGDVVEVSIDGTDPDPPPGPVSASSCALGPYPRVGGVYEVGAYQGSTADGSPRYFANACGGYVREVSGPPTTVAAPPDHDGGGGNRLGWRPAGVVLAGIGVIAVGAALVLFLANAVRARTD